MIKMRIDLRGQEGSENRPPRGQEGPEDRDDCDCQEEDGDRPSKSGAEGRGSSREGGEEGKEKKSPMMLM